MARFRALFLVDEVEVVEHLSRLGMPDRTARDGPRLPASLLGRLVTGGGWSAELAEESREVSAGGGSGGFRSATRAADLAISPIRALDGLVHIEKMTCVVFIDNVYFLTQ